VRIVLDTNVVVSALLWGGTPYRLIQAAVDGALTLCTSPALLAELRGVLAREHLASRLERQSSSVEEALALYDGLAVTVSPETAPRVVVADPDDDHVIAAAVAAKADLVVSGDRHLLDLASHDGIRIVTPAEAVSIIPSRGLGWGRPNPA
jgi:putative PIN family toxin of toxin-antitoxin system